jgi:hypothetical protein
MTMQPQSPNGPDYQRTDATPEPVQQVPSFRVAGLVVMSAAVLAAAAFVGMLVGQFTRLGTSEAETVRANKDEEPDIRSHSGPENLKNWKDPELVLVLSGEMHGYLLPCGCGDPQYGGLERRYNFISNLRKERKWPVVAVDLGDLPQAMEDILAKQSSLADHIRNFQGVLKYTTAMKALDKMQYTAVGIGWRERALQSDAKQGLSVTLDNYALNEKTPRILAANLKDRGEKERWCDMVGDWQLAKVANTRLKVGVTGFVGYSVRHSEHIKGETDVAWMNQVDTEAQLKKSLEEQKKAGVNMRVLIYQGTIEEAKKLLDKFPQFHVVLCLSSSDLAPAIPEQVGDSLIVTVGYKGHSIGVVGVFPTKPNQYEMRYQMVDMGPELKTPEGKEKDNPVLKLLEEYTLTMRDHPEDYLGRYKKLQTPHPIQVQFEKEQPEYVGSKECQRCHASEYKVWLNSPHAKAYEDLTEIKRTVIHNRQYDAECVVCHVTGFGYKTGFTDEKDENFKKLKDVGCESCHGPGSAHIDAQVAKKDDTEIRAAMNKWKHMPQARPTAISSTCLKCHDEENDLHWKYADRWPKIEHPMPEDEKPKGSGSGSGSRKDDK